MYVTIRIAELRIVSNRSIQVVRYDAISMRSALVAECMSNDDYVPSVFAIALQRTAGELETLGDLALRARTRTRPDLSPPAPGTP